MYNAQLLYNRAVAHSRLGAAPDAVADCCAALDLHPAYARALLLRARLYTDAKELAEAVADLERAAELDPAQPKVQHQLAAARARLEAEGVDHYEALPPPPRTKWTRRVPHPVLIGHAASLTP